MPRRAVTKSDIGLKCLWTPNPANFTACTEVVDLVSLQFMASAPIPTTPGARAMSIGLAMRVCCPPAAPNARILRYGYESDWLGGGHKVISTNTTTVADRFLTALSMLQEEVPYRPIIIIAHCFGGLVVLKALLDAKNEKDGNGTLRWGRIFDSITGIIFLGTPFRGSKVMEINEMLEFVRNKHEGVQGEVLRVSEEDDDYLTDLVSRFGMTWVLPNRPKISCFYELQQSDVGAIVGGNERMKVVVSERSGCLDSTDKHSLSRDHFEMNKFETPQDEDFRIVRKNVRDMIESASSIFLARCRDRRTGYSSRFHELSGGPLHIRPTRRDGKYWHSPTLASYEIYEAIYNACKTEGGNDSENINFFSFLLELEDCGIDAEQIKRFWARLPFDTEPLGQPSHSKAYTMAILYMIHIETYDVDKRPQDIMPRI